MIQPRTSVQLELAPRMADFRADTADALLVHVQYPPETDFDTHTHEAAYLCLVTLGSYVEWTPKRRHAIRSGSEVVYQHGSTHAVRTGERGAAVLHVTDPLAMDWCGTVSRDRLGLLWQIHCAVIHRNDPSDDAARLHIDALVSELRPHCPPHGGSWLAHSRARIREGYPERFDLATLARDASVHPSHFARAFRKRYGMTAGEYLRRIRVAAAVRRLVHDTSPPSLVALECGFADQSHMGRYFQRYLQRTPQSFRSNL